MARDFTPEQAVIAIKKQGLTESKSVNGSHSPMYKDYFSLETGEPIPFDQLSKRIKKRFAEIDRSSTSSMLDLFFLHQNWTTFYKRDDSFSKYIKETLQISRTHAYGIINSVKLLNQYFSYKGESAPAMNSFIDEIASSIEDIGIKKLIIISTIKDEDKRFNLVDKLLNGDDISADELENKVERKSVTNPDVLLTNNEIQFSGTSILRFENTVDECLRKSVYKAVLGYYRKLVSSNG